MGVATGTFQYPNTSPVANGLWQFKLSQDCIEFSVACICPPLFSGNLDSNGNLTATFLFNDALLPSLTTYQLTIKAPGGGQVWNETYYLTGTAANITTIPPGGGGTGAAGSLILQTNGVNNSNQLLENLVQGTGITLTNSAGATTFNVTPLVLQTNGTTNSNQYLENLVAGTGIALTNTAGSTTLSVTPRTGMIYGNFAGGGSAVAATSIINIPIPVAMTVTGWELLADRTCSATVAVLGCTYANFPGSLTAITGADIPHITGGVASANFAVSGATWSANLAATSVVQFSVTSATTVQSLACGLIVSIPYA